MRAFNFWVWPWPWYGPWSRYSNLLSDGNGDTPRKREGFLNQKTEVTVSLHFCSFLLNFVLTKMVARLHHSAKTVTSVCQDKSPRVKPKVCCCCCCCGANTGKLGFKWNTTLANILGLINRMNETTFWRWAAGRKFSPSSFDACEGPQAANDAALTPCWPLWLDSK